MLNLGFVYTVTLLVAGCSIIYELLIAHTLSVLAGNTVIWYSITIGVYLLSLGIGSMLCDKFFKNRNLWDSLLTVEILLSIFGAISVMTIKGAHMFFAFFIGEKKQLAALVIFFVAIFLISSIIGLLSGFELPLLINIGNKTSIKRNITNRILGMDYLGSLLGGICFPLFFVPFMGLLNTGFFIATINILSAILIMFMSQKKHYFRLLTGIFILTILITALFNVKDIDQYFLKKFYYHRSSETLSELIFDNKELPNIERRRSLYQKIDFVQSSVREFIIILMEAYSTKYEEDPDFPRLFNLFLEGDFQLNSNIEELYHEYFAHVPVILNKAVPNKVLILGAGEGLLLRELLKYPEIDIVHVDLDGTLVKLAKENPVLKYMNKGALDDPRVKTIIGDGYQFVCNSDDLYDAIYIDFPAPINYTVSKLYSSEFYRFVKKRLNPGGYAVINAPGSAMFTIPDDNGIQKVDSNNSDWPLYYNTLKAAGFKTIIPYVSNLELDNDKKVESILYDVGVFQRKSFSHMKNNEERENKGPTEKQKASIVKQLMLEQRYALQQGFIFIKNEYNAITPEYNNFGAKFYVLDEKRFNLAFALPYAFAEQIDYDKVNSIMRPTLPNIPITNVRIPLIR